MRVVIVSSSPSLSIMHNDNYCIGVDHWCLELMKNNIKIDLAIGDFDFLSEEEITSIKDYAKEFIKLNAIKNETDTLSAVKIALQMSEDILIVGGIKGPRIEHFLVNLKLVSKYNIKMIDDNSLIYKLETGNHMFYNDEYKYISFFTDSNAELTLEGFKYPLTKYNLTKEDTLCISNEVLSKGKLTLKGEVIVIKSKSDE